MIGTSYEILLYLSYCDDIKEELKLTPQRLVFLRNRIRYRKLTEEYMTDLLTRLGCRCLRPRVILPCIVRACNGKLYDEYTFVKLFLTPELADKYGANYDAAIMHAKRSHSIDRPFFNHILHSKRAEILYDNMVLDSIWSYEPIELTMTADKVVQVRNMLASHMPTAEGIYRILTYERNAVTPDILPQGSRCAPSEEPSSIA